MGIIPEVLSRFRIPQHEELAPKKERGFRVIGHQEGQAIYEYQHKELEEHEVMELEDALHQKKPDKPVFDPDSPDVDHGMP